jgi:hypothetical protein
MNTNVKVKLDLTPEQAVKLKRAHKANRSVSIRLAHNQLFTNSGIDVELSAEQYKKVLSAYKSKAGRGVQLSFEPNQVGGILPFLIPLLATLGGIAARVAPVVARAAAVGAKVASTAAKVAPQIAKAVAPTATSLAKGVASGAAMAAGEQAIGAIANKIASDKAQAQAPPPEAQPAQEGQGMRRGRKKQIASGLVPLGGRGLIPLGSQRAKGQGLMTYPSKKKAHRQ